jgi:tRNA A-37 threonylcarbamoyl transferase component Bud32
MNIENKSELINYLQVEHGILIKNTDKFSILRGGVSNKTILYEGQESSMVVKQALKKLRTKSSWYSYPERLKVEANALNWLNTFLPDKTIPKRIFFDEKNIILGMEAVSQPHDNLKDLLLDGFPADDLIEKMGGLLGIIHTTGFNDDNAKDLFFDQIYFRNLRIEPYYEYSASQKPGLKEFFTDLIAGTLNNRHTVVHGDYSPKNILIKNNKLILLDHEVMHYGDPAFDVGFALTHLLSKGNHFNDPVFIKYASIFWSSYMTRFSFPDTSFEERCVRHTLACMLARIYGRSPLEYLTETQRLKQFDITLKLIHEKLTTLPKLFEQFKQNLADHSI